RQDTPKRAYRRQGTRAKYLSPPQSQARQSFRRHASALLQQGPEGTQHIHGRGRTRSTLASKVVQIRTSPGGEEAQPEICSRDSRRRSHYRPRQVQDYRKGEGAATSFQGQVWQIQETRQESSSHA